MFEQINMKMNSAIKTEYRLHEILIFKNLFKREATKATFGLS